MSEYVIGIDLGTSSVKALLVDREGNVAAEASREYPLHSPKAGWSEQDPEQWVEGTLAVLRELGASDALRDGVVEGISFSGQMHGLVLLDKDNRPLRPAILWNDTRTTAQCREIEAKLGGKLLDIARNPALEGFTLPKLLWVREQEPEIFGQAALFLLPKDYVRYRLCGTLHMDYSDAAGTLLLNVPERAWSAEILEAFGLEASLCPPLAESSEQTGALLPKLAEEAGLRGSLAVFAGGADNACGAIGAGILQEGEALCSIGTSGVMLSYESDRGRDYGGKVHFFNHGEKDAYYSMGVTLAAGYSMSWFRRLMGGLPYEELLEGADQVPAGAGGLLFAPYLAGERTPHADAAIRASFIGLDGSHGRSHMARAVMEGITFSLNETLHMYREAGKEMSAVISIGGGARNPLWLQIQADIFRVPVTALANEQGPGMGAAMLAAAGCGWYGDLRECAAAFVRRGRTYEPNAAAADVYEQLFPVYQQVYGATRSLSEALMPFRS
ncbi:MULTISPECIES: xylulokinase [unclassified Paenibacillus]|uniref:xylulokinase n=1 Tax=Paenibacillus TaxID=44249 RepID=UPI00038FF619|nr:MULTISPECIES: xylulokinase [unclassified Paenibacillus]KKC49167.1 xylulose kinase [Paenibacillus sp. D9]CDN44318.1 Xylulose kinase [Paenibacillus sp. P22]